MTARETVEQFLKLWKKHKFAMIDPYLQRTWIANQNKWSRWLKTVYGCRKLNNFTIIQEMETGQAARDFTVKVNVNGKDSEITIRVICEIEPYKPDITGTWGVNPISALRGI